jgi:hypothetical protein
MPPTDETLATEEAAVEKALRKDLTGDTLRGHKLFRGKFEKEHLPWLARIIFGCCIPADQVRWGDARDWDAIEAWADGAGREMRELGVGGGKPSL